jgi:hypothetical protein
VGRGTDNGKEGRGWGTDNGEGRERRWGGGRIIVKDGRGGGVGDE